ncbi:histidine ammonia-lyase-like isoform X2 [Dysidea avara]|uniref:histidine ammonia-lyase-like isoform X2 n=1 Tax=Dysidea avara TaxID=196820 RepID=UPI003324FFFE
MSVMKIFVRLFTSGDYHVVPTQGDESISTLLTEVSKRIANAHTSYCLRVVCAGGGAILNSSDKVKDVLRDGDHVILGPEHMDNYTAGSNAAVKDSQILLHHNFVNINNNAAETIELDGCSLSVDQLILIGEGKLRVKVSDAALQNVTKARELVDGVVAERKIVYGISTGFGKFANTVIDGNKMEELQENLIRSHAVGVGDPITLKQCRMLLALRINVLAKGYSGIRVETLLKAVGALNASCLSLVPQKGTLGASGDLAPLAHLALGLMGEGEMWSAKTGWANAETVLAVNGLKPIQLAAKEGLALINGTQLITSLGAEAVHRAKNIARQADIVAALTLEVLQGTTAAYDADIHRNRPHNGQMLVASRLRSLLHSKVHYSEISVRHKSCGKVQDAYSLRCCPQVHGIAWDTIQFVEGIISTEMNSATDNPMIIADRNCTLSCGNFHGEYPAKALDYLAIGVHELASLSERRIERLVNPVYSGLPAFLTSNGGLNSGITYKCSLFQKVDRL